MNYDSYMDKVLSRLMTPGVALLIVGAVVGYASGKISGLLVKDDEKKQETASLIIKSIGAAVAILGAVLVFAK